MREIDKVAWILVEDGRVLSTRSVGKDVWYLPGGKREPGETDLETLRREIDEELSVEVDVPGAVHLGTFTAQAHGHTTGITVRMTCYRAATRATCGRPARSPRWPGSGTPTGTAPRLSTRSSSTTCWPRVCWPSSSLSRPARGNRPSVTDGDGFPYFIDAVSQRSGLPAEEAAVLARAVLQTLAERVTGDAPGDLVGHLPNEVDGYLSGPAPDAGRGPGPALPRMRPGRPFQPRTRPGRPLARMLGPTG